MPQEFLVVQCYNCHVYQVDIVKKLPKWTCKICNEKQSIMKVYSRGTGKDCRLHVQELNEKRITQETNIHELVNPNLVLANENQEQKVHVDNRQNSKWAQFVENNKTVEELATYESFATDTQMSSFSDNTISRVTCDDQVAYESHLENQLKCDSPTIELNPPGLCLERQIQREELNIDNAVDNSKWSKFIEKCETSEEQIAYESLLGTGEENNKDQVPDFPSDLETKQLTVADENVECIKSYHHNSENRAYDTLEKRYTKYCALMDVIATESGKVQCPLKRTKSKIVEIDKSDNSKRKKFPDSKNIFDCDSQYNIESLLDI